MAVENFELIKPECACIPFYSKGIIYHLNYILELPFV